MDGISSSSCQPISTNGSSTCKCSAMQMLPYCSWAGLGQPLSGTFQMWQAVPAPHCALSSWGQRTTRLFVARPAIALERCPEVNHTWPPEARVPTCA